MSMGASCSTYDQGLSKSFYEACRDGHLAEAEALYRRHGAKINVNFAGQHKQTSLHEAAYCVGRLDIARFLVGIGAELELKNYVMRIHSMQHACSADLHDALVCTARLDSTGLG